MATFIINKVKYYGDKFIYESPFLGKGLKIIEGENGTGKSTFFNLIYFCLSGNVDEFNKDSKGAHKEIVNDTNNFVELEVSVDKEIYIFKRFLQTNDIWVINNSGYSEIYPINRSKTTKNIFSDWILQKLSISVVDIVQGANIHKINFKDLLRLIYHDQQPNPKGIYKQAENENYISDSLLVRKIIFQLLIGKTYSEFYEALSKLKHSENTRTETKSVLNEYVTIAKKLSENNEELNLEHLELKIVETTENLEKLILIREQQKIERPTSGEQNIATIDIIRKELSNVEREISELSSKEHYFFNDLMKYNRLKEDIVLEATQIKKIIHSHEKLNLFNPDTCPYCLHKVERKEGHCVCGNEVAESDYERFFYDSSEYAEILKSKQKSVETIDLAINELKAELEFTQTKYREIKARGGKLKEQIQELVAKIDNSYLNAQLDTIDDKILFAKENISNLRQRIEIEKTLLQYQKMYDEADTAYHAMRNRVRILEIEAEQDINEKIQKFNEYYNELMTKTLKDCKTARIDFENYMPIINNGEYREASSSVPVRLNYFLTFLKLSLFEKGINYPKFILIDTPKTAGIDEKNFNKILGKLEEILLESKDVDFQILFSTGLNEYPNGFNNYVFEKLTDEPSNRLLKLKRKQ